MGLLEEVAAGSASVEWVGSVEAEWSEMEAVELLETVAGLEQSERYYTMQAG